MGKIRRVLSVVGTRPNFMKMAPVVAELARRSQRFESVLVHTGQHYDPTMSDVFLRELGVRDPDFMLDVGSGSHAQQTARVMERLEPVLFEVEPDVVLVPGDVNSTLAAALVASKLEIPIGHVEAGLRSFDRSMPEEINRVLTDQLSDLLFVHSPEAVRHLAAEGCRGEVYRVGNTMIDSLVAMRSRLGTLDAPGRYQLEPGQYLVVTLHRPALVDSDLLATTFKMLAQVSREIPIVFPAHPRTRDALQAQGLSDAAESGLRIMEPMGYLEFLSLVSAAAGVLTDSGGIQEETTYLGIPCFTLRANTERPVTVDVGTNTLLGLAPDRIAEIPALIRQARRRRTRAPDGWDGRAAVRLVEVLCEAQLPAARSSSSARRAASTSRS